MPMITVLGDSETTPPGDIEGNDAVVAVDDLPTALGWQLKPEGLCRDDMCVPVPDQAALQRTNGVSLRAVAGVLGRRVVVDARLGAVAVSSPASTRSGVVRGARVPDLSLPNIDGEQVSLADFRGRRTLLVSFASW